MKLLLAVAVLALVTACTATDDPGQPPLQPGPVTPATPPTTLTVVAHQDDDLLFVNPDLSQDIAAGRRVVTVFTTAGDAGQDRAYWRGREAGARAAYALMAGAPSRWVSRRVSLAGRSVTRVTLVGRPITLIFLRLPDGHGYANHLFQTMHRLWTGRIPRIRAIDTNTWYTRDDLIATLGAVMATYRPDVIRTLDHTGGIGDGDHADHHVAAYFTDAAHRAYPVPHTFTGYRGYPAERQPVNLSRLVQARKTRYFLAYALHDPHVCATFRACLANESYTARLSRRYRTTTERSGARP